MNSCQSVFPFCLSASIWHAVNRHCKTKVFQSCLYSSVATKAELFRSHSLPAPTVQECSYFWITWMNPFYSISFMPAIFIQLFPVDHRVTGEVCSAQHNPQHIQVKLVHLQQQLTCCRRILNIIWQKKRSHWNSLNAAASVIWKVSQFRLLPFLHFPSLAGGSPAASGSVASPCLLTSHRIIG